MLNEAGTGAFGPDSAPGQKRTLRELLMKLDYSFLI